MALTMWYLIIIIGTAICSPSTGTQISSRIGKDHQIVQLISVFHNNFLTVSNATMDKNSRKVRTEKFPAYGWNEWRLIPVAPSQYEIIHHLTNEPLCPLRDDLAFDDSRRNIATWIPGPWTMQCFWEIKQHARGHYLLSSVDYGEYLYSAEWLDFRDHVWTWRKQEEPREKSYHWDVVNVNYCLVQGDGVILPFK